jgi:cytolysin-activating lysine-acyltransferase
MTGQPPSDARLAANGNGHASTGQPDAAGKPATGGTIFTEPTPGGKEKTVAQLFGEIVWLFSQSPKHKNFFVSDLEWLVMTPILLRQFRIFYAPDKPIGVALWGYVNDEVEQRLMTGHARLAPADWKSGEKLWLVDVVAPFGGHDAMIADLKEKVFAGREITLLRLVNNLATAVTL